MGNSSSKTVETRHGKEKRKKNPSNLFVIHDSYGQPLLLGIFAQALARYEGTVVEVAVMCIFFFLSSSLIVS